MLQQLPRFSFFGDTRLEEKREKRRDEHETRPQMSGFIWKEEDRSQGRRDFLPSTVSLEHILPFGNYNTLPFSRRWWRRRVSEWVEASSLWSWRWARPGSASKVVPLHPSFPPQCCCVSECQKRRKRYCTTATSTTFSTSFRDTFVICRLLLPSIPSQLVRRGFDNLNFGIQRDSEAEAISKPSSLFAWGKRRQSWRERNCTLGTSESFLPRPLMENELSFSSDSHKIFSFLPSDFPARSPAWATATLSRPSTASQRTRSQGWRRGSSNSTWWEMIQIVSSDNFKYLGNCALFFITQIWIQKNFLKLSMETIVHPALWFKFKRTFFKLNMQTIVHRAVWFKFKFIRTA